MSELDEVLAALTASGGEGAALATVVAVEGSTYRRPGARLVIPAGDGPTVGNISGGCLEDDVMEKAREVLASGHPQLLRFDLTADDEAMWGWGLGCNGAIEVFVEPARQAVELAVIMTSARRQQRPVVVATLVEGEPRAGRMVLHEDGRREGRLGDPALEDEIAGVAGAAFDDRRSRVTTTLSGTRVFVEVVSPPPRLVVCGAGHDAKAVVEFGARLGWRVEVVDDRRGLLDSSRFPRAARLALTKPLRAAEEVGVDPRTYVVVMSHNFLRDKDYLQSFLGSAAPYLGMLGPRARLERLVGELRSEGVVVNEADLARVWGPAGLDVGADGPEEIAWAIVAEVLAVHRGASGGPLRGRPGRVHAGVPPIPAEPAPSVVAVSS